MDARRQLINELQSTVAARRQELPEDSKTLAHAAHIAGMDKAYGDLLSLLNELEQDCDLAEETNDNPN